MKSSAEVRETVRKLLRAARNGSNKHEQNLARQRAHELMERHGITIVDDNDEHRVDVPGVAGVFWREQICNAIATACKCKLVRSERGKGRVVAVLVGYASDVTRAQAAYDKLQMDLMVRCRAAFVDFNTVWTYEESDIDEDEDVLNMFGEIIGRSRRPPRTKAFRFANESEVYPSWARTFLSTASTEISQRLLNGIKKQQSRGPVVYAPPEKPEFADDEAELKRILGDTRLLGEKFGTYQARDLQREAAGAGTRAASNVTRRSLRAERKKLTAASSWLPPPPKPEPPPAPPEPTRWSELDL